MKPDHAKNELSILHTLWADDPDHECCFLELYYDDKFVVMITMEHNNLELEFPDCESDETMVLRRIKLDWFLKLLVLGKKEFQKSYSLIGNKQLPHSDVQIRLTDSSRHNIISLGLYYENRLVVTILRNKETADLELEFPARNHSKEQVLRKIDFACFERMLEMGEKTIRNQW